MTNWSPELEALKGPRYLAIADALEADRRNGRLPPGTRLPTHRELAWLLKVTVGTVSRAYAEAERRGVTRGEVGRGTYVNAAGRETPMNFTHPRRDGPDIDLAFAGPPLLAEDAEILARLPDLAKHPEARAWLDYQPHLGMASARAAGARWLALGGLEVPAKRIAVTAGAQHGLLSTLAAMTQPGDRVLCEALTFPGFFGAARMLGLKVEGLAMDEEGLLPEALEQSLKLKGAALLYSIPTLQNPTTATMSPGRRGEIVHLCRRYGVRILEDDIFGWYLTAPPPSLQSIAPEITATLVSLSKTLAPGLRVSYLAFPEDLEDALTKAIQTSAIMAPPLMAALAAAVIEDGTAERLLTERRREAEARAALAAEILAPWQPCLPAESIVAWLPLPEPWRAVGFAAMARRQGVVVSPAEHFTPAREATEHAVRICLGPPRDRARLIEGLERLADLLRNPPVTAAETLL